nr:PLDc N-terminal domain-containing protein [Kineococcus siccus]
MPVLLIVAVTVYCLVNCLQAVDGVRTLPRWAWVLLILLFPPVGAVAYLLAGRPQAGPGTAGGFRGGGRPRPPRAPDDDDEFLRGL